MAGMFDFLTPQAIPGMLSEQDQTGMQAQSLLAMAGPLLQAGARGPRRIGVGEALGAGFQNMQTAQQQALSNIYKQKLLDVQIGEAKEKTEQRARQAAYAATLPENLRALALAFPDQVGQRAAEQAFAKQKSAEFKNVVGKGGREITIRIDPLTGDETQYGGEKTDVLSPEALAQKERLAAATRQTSALQEYDYARGQGYTGDFIAFKKELAAAGAKGPFAGTGMDPQVANILLRGDPASSEYAYAYAIATQTPIRFVPNENGEQVPVYITLPPSIPKPVSGQAQQQGGMPPTPPLSAPDGGPIGAGTPGAAPPGVAPSGALNVGQPIPGTGKPASDAQNLSAGFLGRMIGASKRLDQIGAFKPGWWETKAAEWLPGSTGQSQTLEVYRQAMADWVTANLRKESGAVLGKDEIKDEIIKYFPQPGNGPAVIEAKRRSRAAAEAGMRLSAGPAARNIPPPNTDPLPMAGGRAPRVLDFKDLPQ